MEKMLMKISADLQKFIDKFQPISSNLWQKDIEVSGVTDIYRNVSQAKALIENLGLELFDGTIIDHTYKWLLFLEQPSAFLRNPFLRRVGD